MSNFLILPLETKLHIASYLDTGDHYRFARTCQQTWGLLHQAVGINKLREKYGHTEAWPSLGFNENEIAHTLDRVSTQPAFKVYTKSVVILNDCGYPERNRSELENFEKEELGNRLEKYYKESFLQAILPFEEPYQDHFMSILLIVSLPVLEELAFDFNGEQILLDSLMASYWHDTTVAPGLFRHLTHVQLTGRAGRFGISDSLVHHLSLLPSMRQIEIVHLWSRDSQANETEELKHGRSDVKELSLHKALLRIDWLDYCLPMYNGLQRFSYSHSNMNLVVYDPKALIKALLRNAAHSLLSLHLRAPTLSSGFSRTQTLSQTPLLSLQHFQKLQLLRCAWSDIIPKEDRQSVSYDQDFPAKSSRLIDILPKSLVVLQIEPDRNNAEKQLIDYINSNPSNLRRIDWPDPSEALKQAAMSADIELHPVVEYKGWSCVIGCDDELSLKQNFGIIMPPEHAGGRLSHECR